MSDGASGEDEPKTEVANEGFHLGKSLTEYLAGGIPSLRTLPRFESL